ncbi:5-carboxymethyl-2-hydroxymuconate Delta-isomerase [Aliamphritea hakodatensis]|uniref:5-carboxymethyl-2-hydroxymuconate Delta-isomerase n=1 Tax=Aliamphritea hakodatensis TaxID=2895352 RepID=UPI0022FD9EA9|nr:5-carboxymethyl-2-hydroxymuconate Delta-isomerase [Aliamphritea hakodatensis]
MPHCILECSPEILKHCNQQVLMQHCFDAAVASGLFSPEDIKVRILRLENQQVGETALTQLHTEVKILDGRTAEQRKHLSEKVLHGLHTYLSEAGLSQVSLSVEVSEIERASYSKIIL